MKKLRISFVLVGALMFGVGVANVPALIKSAIAGSCSCADGCPCSHCSKKSNTCSCKK